MLVFIFFRSMSSSMSWMSRCKTLQTRSSIGLEIEKSSLPESSEASMWTSNIRHPLVVLLVLFSSFSSSEKRVSFVFFVFFLRSPLSVEDDEHDGVGGFSPEANFFFLSVVVVFLFALLLLLEVHEKERREQRGRHHPRE